MSIRTLGASSFTHVCTYIGGIKFYPCLYIHRGHQVLPMSIHTSGASSFTHVYTYIEGIKFYPCPGFSKSFKVDGEFLEVGGNWTCHRHVRHVPERQGGESERVVSPLLVCGGSGGPPVENFEILDGRRCNLGIYLRKLKLLIGLINAGFLG